MSGQASEPLDRGSGVMPVRVQRSCSAGWRMPAGAVYVGRPPRWSNPHRVDEHGAAEAVVLCRAQLQAGPGPACRDACRAWRWCPLDGPCHADVLLEFANRADGVGR